MIQVKMEIQVQRLREALEILQPVVPRKAKVPILTNVLLKEGQAVATDLEVACMLDLPEVGQETSLLLPHHPVEDLLRRVPWNETLKVEVEGGYPQPVLGARTGLLQCLTAGRLPTYPDS